MQVPHKYHASTTQAPCKYHASTMQVLCRYYASTMQVPRKYHTSTTQVSRKFHASTTQVPRKYHTSTTQVSRLMLNVNFALERKQRTCKDHNTVAPPPHTREWQKRRYWKTAVKGVIYNQEKTYSGLENQRQYWAEWSTEGRYWGDYCNNKTCETTLIAFTHCHIMQA